MKGGVYRMLTLIRAGNRVAVCEPNQTGSGKRV